MVGGWDKHPGPGNDYSSSGPPSEGRNILVLICIAAAASWYFGWPEVIWGKKSLEAQEEAIESFFRKNRFGSAPDVYLTKLNALGQQERVAIIYGFMDDLEFCGEVAELYQRKHPEAKYSCSLAN